MRLKLAFLCKVWYNIFTNFKKGVFIMSTATNEKNYESQIKEFCFKASSTMLNREGERDRKTGCPIGLTVWAIAAKQLWVFQRDGITPLSLEQASDPNKVFEAFKDLYFLPEGSNGFIGDYVLKG